MPIVHIILIAFQPLALPEEVMEHCNKLLALKDQCVHPETKKPYIKASRGGKENSPEGLQDGIQFVFVTEFLSEEDRKYYLEKDPAHLAFVDSLKGAPVAMLQVVDFCPGVF